MLTVSFYHHTSSTDASNIQTGGLFEFLLRSTLLHTRGDRTRG